MVLENLRKISCGDYVFPAGLESLKQRVRLKRGNTQILLTHERRAGFSPEKKNSDKKIHN